MLCQELSGLKCLSFSLNFKQRATIYLAFVQLNNNPAALKKNVDFWHSTLEANTWPLLTFESSSHKDIFLEVGDLKGFHAHKNVSP